MERNRDGDPLRGVPSPSRALTPPDGMDGSDPVSALVAAQVGREEQAAASRIADELERFAMEREDSKPQGDFKNPVVDVLTFCRDYARAPLYPGPQVKAALAIWGRKAECWRDSPIREGYLFWGKRGGKDTIASGAVFAYAAYKILSMRDPWNFFGKPSGDSIDLINVSFNAAQARKVFFQRLKSALRRTVDPLTGRNWFEARGIDLSEGGKSIQNRVIYLDPGHSIAIHSGDSLEYTGEGLNLLFSLFDEYGSFKQVSRAIELRKALHDTAITTFPEHAFTLAVSYQYSLYDAMTIDVKAAEKAEGTVVETPGDALPAEASKKSTVYVSRAATWEANKKIPRESLALEYMRNPERAKRVWECRGEAKGGGFFRYLEEVRGRVSMLRENPIIGDASPVSGGTARLPWATRDLAHLPLRDSFRDDGSGKSWHVHIDLAKGAEGGDKAGLCMAHKFRALPSWSASYLRALSAAGLPLPEGVDIPEDDSRVFQPGAGERDAIWIGLMIQVAAPFPGGEIRFQDFIDFLTMLRDTRKFNIAAVTYDGWQSTGEIQRMGEAGFKSCVLSVDRTPGPANGAKELIYTGLADYYYHPIFLREAEELQEDGKNGKVDHPERSPRREAEEGEPMGSKDVWDGFAGCVAALLDPSLIEKADGGTTSASWVMGSVSV